MKLPYLPDHDGSSFFDFVSTHHPELALRTHGMTTVPDQMRPAGPVAVPSATTVLAIKYQQGVVIAWRDGQVRRFSWETLRHLSTCEECQQQSVHLNAIAQPIVKAA